MAISYRALPCLLLRLVFAGEDAWPPNLTVSGQSAGGSMAMQHLVAFSKSVRGAAIAAGSPYGCGAFEHGHEAGGGACYYGGTDVQKTIHYIHKRFQQGLIDDPVNLWSTPVVVFNGRNDWTVYTKVSREIVEQLREFVKPENVVQNFDTNAAHVWSLDHGECRCGACAYYGSGLCCDVNNCAYDLAGDMLRHSYGLLKPRTFARQAYYWVQQGDYLPPKTSSWKSALLAKWGVIYVPTDCKQDPTECRLHVHYHGCIANMWAQRRRWINNLDLNEYGEANNIIIFYPQVHGDEMTGLGCWNWGFQGDDHLFDTKQSVQLQTVMNIVNDLPNIIRNAIELPLEDGPPDDLNFQADPSTFV